MVADSNRVLSLERVEDYHDQLRSFDCLPSCFKVVSELLHPRAISTRPIALVVQALSILKSPALESGWREQSERARGLWKKQTRKLEQSRGCNHVQERNQRKGNNGVMLVSYVKLRPPFKQRGNVSPYLNRQAASTSVWSSPFLLHLANHIEDFRQHLWPIDSVPTRLTFLKMRVILTNTPVFQASAIGNGQLPYYSLKRQPFRYGLRKPRKE